MSLPTRNRAAAPISFGARRCGVALHAPRPLVN